MLNITNWPKPHMRTPLHVLMLPCLYVYDYTCCYIMINKCIQAYNEGGPK